jgi:RanGTP-binding protein
MEGFLSTITQHAMNYAIRSGIAITSGFAIKQCSRLLHTVDGRERDQIVALQRRLESKIRIISPAIDMIDLIAARGNTSLDSAVALTKSIRYEIQALGLKLAAAADSDIETKKSKSSAKSVLQLGQIIAAIERLLAQIEDAVPLINLAITTSGVNLSTALPVTVSPSRLLQASTFLSAGDSAYGMFPGQPTQVGPVFVLSLYMLFEGHSARNLDNKRLRKNTWKEVIHKARIKVLRVPLDRLFELPTYGSDPLKTSTLGRENAESGDYFPRNVPSDGKAHEFAYQLLVIEDLDDDRFHDFEDEGQPTKFDDVKKAGIREVIPMHEISKIFYADSGKILNIRGDDEPNNPVLLLKRDVNAIPPRRMMNRETPFSDNQDGDDTGVVPTNPTEEHESDDESVAQLQRESSCLASPDRSLQQTLRPVHNAWKFPAGVDPEWLAFEVFVEPPDSEDDDPEPDDIDSTPENIKPNSVDSLNSPLSRLSLKSSQPNTPKTPQEKISPSLPVASPAATPISTTTAYGPPALPALRTSLSLLELLIRLTALQQFQQCSHLAISDELLNFFLSESSSTGAGADSERRKMMRSAARRQVGFDPYAESPIKLRGEEYLRRYEGDFEEEEAHGGNEEGGDDDFASTPPLPHPPVRHYNTPRSVRSSNDIASSPRGFMSSPSLRGGQNSKYHHITGNWTPAGDGHGRKQKLQKENGRNNRGSPLIRSESDSTLGTSPGTAL